MTRRKKLLFAFIACSGVLLLLEGAVRIRERILYGTFARAGTTLYEPSNGGVLLLKPGTNITGSRFQASCNSLGFRGPEVARPKPAGTFRIVCIGGSTTFDTFAHSNEEAWPARLERLLREKHPGVEVVNAGVPGHTLGSSLSDAMWPKIESCEPDLIVCYHATNEIVGLAKATYGPKPTETKRSAPAAFVKWLTDESLFAYKVWLVVDKLSPPPKMEAKGELPESGAREFEATLNELVRRTAAKKVKLALGTFALRWRADQPADVKERLSQGAANELPGLSLDAIDRAFARYNAVIEKIAHERGAVLIPVASELAGHEEFFGDIMHHSELGSKKMAELVARALEDGKVFEKP